ncbi:hypothetical protein PC115_g8870 [Phytophthora cactorum]|uniref:Uncharacterized protein n=1 Tax=Phytophthora cactorum TaxID=29920 RepID=A0A8T1CFD0_9STRA|nr:hypothetical protein PC115_g8870 [Phytophthora cactorum]
MHYLAVGPAVFQGIVKTIEYPLYAHLDPGQRFGANLSRSALLALIHMGEEFKVTLSRITLDTVARVLTVTFKGKKTTAWWVNLRLPLARRLLTLRDYERQRDTTKVTYELEYTAVQTGRPRSTSPKRKIRQEWEGQGKAGEAADD